MPIGSSDKDPRFRYPYPVPRNITQASSAYYLPNEQDHKFSSLKYQLNLASNCSRNIIVNSGSTESLNVSCSTDSDCEQFLVHKAYCNPLSVRFVNVSCTDDKLCDFRS